MPSRHARKVPPPFPYRIYNTAARAPLEVSGPGGATGTEEPAICGVANIVVDGRRTAPDLTAAAAAAAGNTSRGRRDPVVATDVTAASDRCHGGQ